MSLEIEEDESACPNGTTHFYEFKEYDTVLKLIEDLPRSVKDMRTREKSHEQFLLICDKYQEQPHLIDPYLLNIFEKLSDVVKGSWQAGAQAGDAVELINESFKYMHALTKMRGFKKIVQYLPHETNDLEPVISLLERQNTADVNVWQTRYLLLIWLSIVCMIPFDLNRFDGSADNKNEKIMNRMLNMCIPYLSLSDKCQDASSFVLAKFMSRQDIRNTIMPQFFQQLFTFVNESKKSGNSIRLLGALKCLANIYKYGKREDLLAYTLPTLRCIIDNDLLSSQLAVVRKFYVKLIQRIGTTFFRFKIAKWRYQRGSRILMTNLTKGSPGAPVSGQDKPTNGAADQQEEEEEEQIPSEIEDIIESLLNGLKDKDTIVRWSSAKGIGRITNRLSKDMAEDILSSVLDLFTYVDDDSAWHGGCLAIAELGRRGLLLPKQLKLVVPIIIKALVFDKKLGNYSLGRNVRDSACYVCWSFARAFEPEVIQPFVDEIAGALLIVTIFDREVNCRRAASAAFQENVGRQGQFPHGIDIVTKCDYFAVGQIHNCYLNLSVFICEFDEYRKQMIDHLLEHKFNHWDQNVRDLSAQALYELTPLCPDYMAFNVLPKLLRYSLSIDLNTRHGSLLCMGQLIHALSEHARSINDLDRYFGPVSEIRNELVNVLKSIFEEKYFKGSGGEYIRPAVCFFIKKLSLSKLFDFDEHPTSLVEESFFKECDHFIVQCIEYNKDSVQEAVVECLPYYCDLKFVRYSKRTELNASLIQNSTLVQQFINSCNQTSKEYVRCGYSLALGGLPKYLLEIDDNFYKCVRTLIKAVECTSGPIKSDPLNAVKKEPESDAGWVIARKDAIQALTNLFRLMVTQDDLRKLSTPNDPNKILSEVYECLFQGLNDYSTDSKGDSGSRVREASIEALEFLTELCAKLNVQSVVGDEELMRRLFSGIIQQAVERIDRTRNIAGKVFANLLYNQHLLIDNFAFSSSLKKIFIRDECASIDWNVAYVTLPLFIKLINVKPLQTSILIGFIYSIGSLTESLVKSATSSFMKEIKHLEKENLSEFREIIEKIIGLSRSHLKVDRLSSSLIKTVDLIIQSGLLSNDKLADGNYPLQFLEIFLENVKTTKDMQRLTSYVDFFCDMLQFTENQIRQRSMSQLMILLCHQYARIRRATASKLFEGLINYPDIFDNDDDNNECVTLLSETDWDQAVDKLRPIRNRICDLTKTAKPVLKKTIPTPAATPNPPA